MKSYDPTANERTAPIQTRTDMNPNALPPTVDDFPPMHDGTDHRPEFAEVKRESLGLIDACAYCGQTTDEPCSQFTSRGEARKRCSRLLHRGDDGTKREPLSVPSRCLAEYDTSCTYPGCACDAGRAPTPRREPTPPRLIFREVDPTVPYPDASTDEMEAIRLAICGDYGTPTSAYSVESCARALWNEIDRLRRENAQYRTRHREQEQAIVRARAERDTLRASPLAGFDPKTDDPRTFNVREDTVPWPKVVAYAGGANEGGLHSWVDVHLDDTDKPTRFVRPAALPVGLNMDEAIEALRIMTEQRNEARQELAAVSNVSMDLAQARGEVDRLQRELDASQRWVNDLLVSRVDKSDDTPSGIVRALLDESRHERYTLAILPAVIACATATFTEASKLARKHGHAAPMPDEPELHREIVREARALATEAVRQAVE